MFDDTDMSELVASIKVNGLLSPIIVRNKADGRYELISGHRRKWAYHTFIHSTDYHIGLLQYFVLYRIFVSRLVLLHYSRQQYLLSKIFFVNEKSNPTVL